MVQVYLDVDSKNLTNLYDYLKSSWGIGVSDNIVIETDTSKPFVERKFDESCRAECKIV